MSRVLLLDFAEQKAKWISQEEASEFVELFDGLLYTTEGVTFELVEDDVDSR